jgi:hypothetical protein
MYSYYLCMFARFFYLKHIFVPKCFLCKQQVLLRQCAKCTSLCCDQCFDVLFVCKLCNVQDVEID